MAGPDDLTVYDALKLEIAQQVATLRSGGLAAGSGGAVTAAEIDERLSRLQSDFAVVVAHSELRLGAVQPGEFRCRHCGEARTCATIRRLQQDYAVAVTSRDPSDSGSRSDDLEKLVADPEAR